jgi:large repetitive protein
MFFRRWLSFSRSTRSVAKRRRNRREAWFVQQAICSGLGVEALESRQLLSATVLGTSAQAIGFNGAVGTGGGQSSAITPAVTPGVTPTVSILAGFGANSPPSASAPPTGSVNENSSLSFSTANSNAISITDAAAVGTDADSLTLSVSQGTLTVASTTGLSFTSGANGSSSFTVSGTVTNLNAALNGLVYQPTSLYSGSDSLSVSVTDPSGTLSASTSVSITVAALNAPAMSGPGSGSLTENGSFTFSSGNSNAISIADAAAGTNADSLTLSVSQGTLTLASTAGLSFTSGANGSSSFTVSGTVTNLDSALDGLVYQPTTLYSGADSLSVSVTDPGDTLSASTSVPIAVTALSAPTISAPGSGSLSENGSLTLSSGNSNAISITDAAAGTNTDSLTLSVSQGTLTLASTAGLSFTSGANDSSSFTVSGTVTNLDSALNGLVYQPTTLYSGADSLAASVSDPTDSLSASTSVSITVTALSAPAISGPGSPSLTGNGSLAFSGGNGSALSFTDSGSGADSDSLSQSVSQGTMALGSATGLSFTAGTNGSATFTASSPVAGVNSALNAVTYPGDALSSSTNASLTVNALAAPAITALGTAPATENISLVFSSGNGSGISVIDAAAGSNSDSLSLSVSHGRLTPGPTIGSSFTAGTNGSPSFTATGAIANLNAALSGLTHAPTSGYTGADPLGVLVSDPTDRLSNSSSVALTVNAASPRAITAPATGSMSENRSLVFSAGNNNAVSFTNAGAGVSTDSLTLSVAHGMLTSASTTGLTFTTDTTGSASFTVSGPAADLNAALDGLTYKPTSDSLSLSDSDRGDILSAATAVVFNVAALSAPAIVAPPSGTLDQNGSLVFSTSNGNAIGFKGAAAGSGSNSLTLSVLHGTIMLASTTGLTFTTGVNGSASFTVMGTAANLNAALSGMIYTPTRSFSGSDSLAMHVSDANGQSALTSVALRVNVIAPTLTAPTTGTVPQNGTLTFYKRAIRIADVNASTDIEQVVLTATHGNLKLGSTTGITFVSGANNSTSMTISGTLTSLNAGLNGLRFTPTTANGSGTISIKYTGFKSGLSVSTNIAVTIGTSHASFGPSVQTASRQSTVVSPGSQATPSTVGGTISSADLLDTVAADELARWDKFMAEMGLLNRS